MYNIMFCYIVYIYIIRQQNEKPSLQIHVSIGMIWKTKAKSANKD